ncbi:MAG: UDP-glucose 4-epimerase GalE [Flavobacteriaceae bacterium]|nr:UDP-glucose 4-epimerase GalE [Flavobacteriaceae bacterium]
MKNILVTGGLGYIGSHTVVELYNKGYNPIVLDDKSNSEKSVIDSLKKLTKEDLIVLDVDIKNINSLRENLTKINIDGVIHFAAYKSVGESVNNPLKYYSNNITGIINILMIMQDLNINNFIFSSSCTVYGETNQVPIGEFHPVVEAMSPYGNTKQIGEEIIKDLVSSTDFKAYSLRYFNPIGAHGSGVIGELAYGVPNHLVPYLTQVANGTRGGLNVFGNDYNTIDGTCIRDYIHVVDLAKAHIYALDKLLISKEGRIYDVYNLGTGKGTSVLELISAFEKVNKIKIPYNIVERRSGDVEQAFADVTKANKELNWFAKLSIEDALKSAWKWQSYYDKKQKYK